MYHLVLVPPHKQSFLCFLWKNPDDVGPKSSQMTVHIFSAVSSPTSCIYASLDIFFFITRFFIKYITPAIKPNYISGLIFQLNSDDCEHLLRKNFQNVNFFLQFFFQICKETYSLISSFHSFPCTHTVPTKSLETRGVFSAFNRASYGLTCPQFFRDNSCLSYRILIFKTPFSSQNNVLSPWLFSNHGNLQFRRKTPSLKFGNRVVSVI